MVILSSIEKMPSAWSEVVAIGGTIALVLTGSLVWAFISYQRMPGHRHRHRHHHKQPLKPAVKTNHHAGKRGHRRHHEHRPFNPTLAQTGGLPPKRPEAPSDLIPPESISTDLTPTDPTPPSPP